MLGEVTYRPKNAEAQHHLEYENVTVASRSKTIATFIRFLSV